MCAVGPSPLCDYVVADPTLPYNLCNPIDDRVGFEHDEYSFAFPVCLQSHIWIFLPMIVFDKIHIFIF